MKLTFEFSDKSKVQFENYLQIGLKVYEGGKQCSYSPEKHINYVAKVLSGLLREDVTARVQEGQFETISNMLDERIEALRDVIQDYERGIKLCECLHAHKDIVDNSEEEEIRLSEILNQLNNEKSIA